MCRVTRPELRNLVVHFRINAPEDKERLTEVGRRKSYATRRNFYVLKLVRHSTAKSWSGSGEGGGRIEEKRRRGRPRRRQEVSQLHTLSFTVFPTSGSVIATGVRSSIDIISALGLFRQLVGVRTSPSTWSRQVVNSTYVGSIVCSTPIFAHRSLAKFKARQRERRETVNISFRPQFFPGGLVRWSDTSGSVNLFNNGNYVVVGVKKEEEALLLGRRLCALIKTHWTTTTSRTSCAWTAD